jgi:hypothetical protein
MSETPKRDLMNDAEDPRWRSDDQWHLDKKVPLALIITIVGQTVVAAWGASNLWTRVGELERQMQTAAPQFERIIRLETKVDGISGSLAEIKMLIDRREPRP